MPCNVLTPGCPYFHHTITFYPPRVKIKETRQPPRPTFYEHDNRHESDKRSGLSPTTSGVCSCMFGFGTFWLHTMVFQTSTYMSTCMSICMCVCSSVCLHQCMYMSRTHNTLAHTHVNTTYTTHNNEFSTQRFFHQISFSDGPKHPNYSDESAPQS